METLFALFEEYEDAREALDELIDRGFPEGEMNVVVQEEIAKNYMEVSLEEVEVKATKEVGEKEIRGLDAMLGTERPIDVPGIGEVLGAGVLATAITKAAMASIGTFADALTDFDVDHETARAYEAGVENEGLLFWTRVSEDRAPEAGEVLQEQHGQRITSVAG